MDVSKHGNKHDSKIHGLELEVKLKKFGSEHCGSEMRVDHMGVYVGIHFWS